MMRTITWRGTCAADLVRVPLPISRTHCGHCHTCGAQLLSILDGEEWCPKCEEYHRYTSHGWGGSTAESSPCPEAKASEANASVASVTLEHLRALEATAQYIAEALP